MISTLLTSTLEICSTFNLSSNTHAPKEREELGCGGKLLNLNAQSHTIRRSADGSQSPILTHAKFLGGP